MSTIRFRGTTAATPAEFLAALTDFGPGRSALFGNSADRYLQVHHRGLTDADVTEGSGGIWERLRYDWSDPARVVLTTTDSNVFGGRSGHTYTLTPQHDGATTIDVVVTREGKNLRGRLLAGLIGSVGKRSLAKQFTMTLRAVESASGSASASSDAA